MGIGDMIISKDEFTFYGMKQFPMFIVGKHSADSFSSKVDMFEILSHDAGIFLMPVNSALFMYKVIESQ